MSHAVKASQGNLTREQQESISDKGMKLEIISVIKTQAIDKRIRTLGQLVNYMLRCHSAMYLQLIAEKAR